MSSEKHGYYTKMHKLREDQQESAGLLGGNCIVRKVIPGEDGPKSAYGPFTQSTPPIELMGQIRGEPSWD
jgi:hypothetical protein